MKLGFQNIRVFKNFTEFDIKPITVLTGPNNSGKSVVSKMLYLLKHGFKKDSSGRYDLTKLYFTDEILKEAGSFNENITRNSIDESILLKIESDENNFFETKNNNFIFLLEYSKPSIEENLDFAIIKTIKVFYKDKIIIHYEFIESKVFINEKENYVKKLYKKHLDEIKEKSILNSDYNKQELNPEDFNRDAFKDIIFRSKHDEEIISNIFYFLLEEVKSNERRFKSKKFNGPNWLSEREEISKLLRHYTTDVEDLLFKSYFSYLVLSDVNFFKSSNKKKKSIYERYIKYILDIKNINSHTAFIKEYLGFERSLLKSFLEKSFKIGGYIYYNQSSSDLINSRGYDKYKIDQIETIENPLTNLFLLEFEAKNWFKNSKPKITEEHISIIESFTDKTKGKFFDIDRVLVYNTFIANNLNFNNFNIPSLNFYNQKQSIQEYYLESEKQSDFSSFYKFGYKYNKNEISKESKNFVDKWIKKLGLGNELLIQPIKVKKKTIGFSFYIKEGKNEYPLKDNGYGINKLLQILLEIAAFKAIDYNNLDMEEEIILEVNGKINYNKTLLLE